MELTVITGMSGAGKSQAMGAFEDAGWFCVDNLPPGLLPALADLFLLEGSRVERAAVVCDVRGGVWFKDLEPVLERVEAGGAACGRGSSSSRRPTRRSSTASARPAGPHPLSARGRSPTASSASATELADVRGRGRRGHRHHRRCRSGTCAAASPRRSCRPEGRPRMHVQFVSFGYKHGVPRDADLLFDVRFLAEPALRAGAAPLHRASTRPWPTSSRPRRAWRSSWPRLEGLLDFLLPAYARGGQDQRRDRHRLHRAGATAASTIAEMLARRYSPRLRRERLAPPHRPRERRPRQEPRREHRRRRAAAHRGPRGRHGPRVAAARPQARAPSTSPRS